MAGPNGSERGVANEIGDLAPTIEQVDESLERLLEAGDFGRQRERLGPIRVESRALCFT